MNTLEDRLGAALTARADQVRPEDLRYAAPPPVRSRLPRVAAYTLAAAACAAAIAVPFVVGGGGPDGDTAPDLPPATQTPTPNGDDLPGGDWTVAYSYPRAYDVDGDGASDEIVVRTEGEEDLPPGTRRVEAHLSTGGVAAVLLDYETFDLTMVEPIQLDGAPGDEILFYRGTATEQGAEMGVLDLVDGALVDLTVPADPGITSGLDDQGRLRARWVEDGALYSSRSVISGFTLGDGGKPIPKRYGVDVWRWSLVDGALVAVEQPQRCIESPAQDHPTPCADPGSL